MEQRTSPRGQLQVPPADHFLWRLLQDLIDQQLVEQWLKRAEWFDTCSPFLALQCRRHAWLLANPGEWDEMPADVRQALA